jgi:hypothetical protein
MKSLFTILFVTLFGLTLSAQTYKGSERPKTNEQRLNDEFCTGLFHSAEGTILDVAATPGVQSYLNILDWLQGRVAGLQIYKNRAGVSIPVIRGGIPAIFVDEIQVDLHYLETLNINEIGIVKIIKSPFFGGYNGSHGAIAIYTGYNDEKEE